jgi:DNA-binding response OmpR family regulator
MAQKLTDKMDWLNLLCSPTSEKWLPILLKSARTSQIQAFLAEREKDALDIIANNKIHLAILDMDETALNALHVVRMLRYWNRALPCILTARQANSRALQEALRLHVEAVLSKPISTVTMLEKVRKLFMKHYRLDPYNNGIDLETRGIPGHVDQPPK